MEVSCYAKSVLFTVLFNSSFQMIYIWKIDNSTSYNTGNIKGAHVLFTTCNYTPKMSVDLCSLMILIYVLLRSIGSYDFDENYCLPKMASQKLIHNCLLEKIIYYSGEYYQWLLKSYTVKVIRIMDSGIILH